MKAVKKEKPASDMPHKGRSFSLTVRADELSPKALQLISRADELEGQLQDVKDALNEVFPEIVREIGHPTFDHPGGRGHMTIMTREGAWYWRSKPKGKQRSTPTF
jgi:hypothetical protein